MHEPSPRTSRLAIAASLAALIVIGGGGFLLGRQTAPLPPPPPAIPVAKPEKPAATEAKERILSRADLIALGNAAADASASGAAMPKTIETAPGQRFQLYLPFGCEGPAGEGSDAALRWRMDPESSTLRIHVAPTQWAAADWWQTPPAGIEALEGFWITRPWTSEEKCGQAAGISPPGGIQPITLAGQTLGVAQLITSETPRQLRRGDKPYEAALRVDPESMKLDGGLRVRLRGRIATFPQGSAVRCAQPGGREQRPVCLIAVSLDEVAIENPASEEALVTWTPTIAGPGQAES